MSALPPGVREMPELELLGVSLLLEALKVMLLVRDPVLSTESVLSSTGNVSISVFVAGTLPFGSTKSISIS